MAATDNPTGRPTIDVRKNAEQRVPKTSTDVSGMSAEEIGGLLYELEVHQEELKIQNEELRRTQLELESSHDRLADLYDFAPVGYVTVDANGLIIHANLTTATMLGQERSKIVGTRLALYCEEGSRIQLRDHIEKVLASKTSQSCELKFTTPAGATLDVRLHSNHLVASGASDDRKFRVIMTDISRYKIAESSLRESEERYRRLVENSPFCIHEIELDGTLSAVNPAGLTMAGLPDESELHGVEYLNEVRKDDRPRIGKLLEQARQGQSSRFELGDLDGQVFESCFVPLTDDTGKVQRIMGIAQDISERKRSEAALRDSERLFRTIFEQAAVGVAQLDTVSGVILQFNKRYCDILGLPEENLAGKTWMELTHPDDVDANLASRERLLAGDIREFAIEKRLQRPDGSFAWIHLTVSPMWQPGEEPTTHIAIVKDITERKQAEESLRISEERYRVLTENATEAIVVMDVDTGRFIDFNQKACDLYKVSSEQLRQMGPAETSPVLQPSGEPSESLAMQHIRQTLEADGLVHVFEWTHMNSDGELIPCEVRIVRIPDPSRRLLRGAVTDITARKEAEEALRESQERFRQLAENINDVFWLHDLVANKVLYVSPPYEKNWGRSVEALYADPLEWAKAIHPDDRDRVEKSFLEQAALDEWVEEYRIVRPDATERRILDRAFPIRDESGTVIRLAGISEDVTDRKNVELALRESEEKFRVLTEKSPAIVLIARQDRILYCNPMLSAVTDYSREELLRMPMQDIVHPDYRESIAERQRRRLNGEDVPQRYDGKIVTKRGEERWLDVSAQVIEFEGAPAVLVTCVNVTERKLAEAALRQSEEALRDANASLELRVAERTAELTETNAELTAFAHTVSHDLRAPLRAMEGFATALSEDYGERLDGEGHEFIQHIVDSAQRMDRLISDLLTYSRLGREKLSIHPISLNSIANEALSHLRADLEACDAKVDVAEQMATVLGHRSTLVHVVTNLLSNAMKFVAPSVRPEVRLWTEAKADASIRLWVEDNGIGIDAAYQDRIFRVFERLHGMENYPGTGIGLAVVARACERLGCRCGVESQLGQGSRFWVELPEGDR